MNGTRVPLVVPLSGRLYEGHFPGRPILPGIALLDLVLRALSPDGAAPSVREITSLRLRRLVAPGDALDIEVATEPPEVSEGGRVRFEVRSTTEVVATGDVVLGDPLASAMPAPTGAGPAGATGQALAAADLDLFLPHRPPARLVEAIEADSDDGVACRVRIPTGSGFVETGSHAATSSQAEAGSAPGLVAIEMAAQAAALFEALRRARETGVAGARVGYLVGARGVRLARARLPAGEPLLASVRLSGMAPPLSTYAFEIAGAGDTLASGTVSTWLTATAA